MLSPAREISIFAKKRVIFLHLRGIARDCVEEVFQNFLRCKKEQLGASFFTFFKMQLRVKRRNLAQLGVIARSKSF